MEVDHSWLRARIRDVADFPEVGIMFRDITPLLADPAGLRHIAAGLAAPYREGVDHVLGIEARGFILGGPVAMELGVGFVPARKSGKLPGVVVGVDYVLEYGVDRLEVHADSFEPGARVLVVDDVLATGGTAEAACALVEAAGGQVVGPAFLAELVGLSGRLRLAGRDVRSLIAYD